MLRYIVRRVAVMIPTLLFVITLSYALMRLAPGGPFSQEKKLPPAILKNLDAKYGFDKPVLVQYARYMNGLLHGDFGPSSRHEGRSVNDFIREGFPVSLELAIVAMILALSFGLLAGMLGAVYRGRWPDKLMMTAALGGLAVPNFVLAPLLIFVFALTLQWLPAARFLGPRHVILPAISLAAVYVAYIARLVRTGLVETINMEFIRTARAKGLSESAVVLRHALPLGLLPVVSFLGPAAVGLLTSSVVVEKIFDIPGLGRYFVDAAVNRDFTLALGIVVIDASALMLMNLAVDLFYGVLDPRVRHAQENA